MATQDSWGTSDEIKLINLIAKDRPKVTLTERKRKLRGYIKSCSNRYVWDNIDRKKCEMYAQEKLAEL